MQHQAALLSALLNTTPGRLNGNIGCYWNFSYPSADNGMNASKIAVLSDMTLAYKQVIENRLHVFGLATQITDGLLELAASLMQEEDEVDL